MGDPFDKLLLKLHSKVVQLAYEVEGSALVIHRSSSGAVQLSATPNVEAAVARLGGAGVAGRSLLRQLFGSAGTVVELEWLEWKPCALIAERKARQQAWSRRGDTLKRMASEALQLPQQRPFFLYALAAADSISCGSSEGQQLVASEWWLSTVVPAFSAPAAGPFAAAAAGVPSKKRRRAAASSDAGASTSGGEQLGTMSGQRRSSARRQLERQSAAAEATGSGGVDPGLPSPPEASGAAGPAPDALQQLLSACVAAPSARVGSAAWYAQCLANNPALIRPIRLVGRKFAMANFSVAIGRPARSITSEPVEVRLAFSAPGLALVLLVPERRLQGSSSGTAAPSPSAPLFKAP